MHTKFAQRYRFCLSGCDIIRGPATITRLGKIGGVVKRNRFNKNDNPAIFMRQLHTFAQHRRCVGRTTGNRDNDTRNIGQHGKAVVVVEMPAKAFLIGQAGNAHDHRVAILLVGEKAQRRRFAPNLVLGIVQISEELDFGDRYKAIVTQADCKAEDGLFIEKRVKHARGTKFFLQALRHAVNAALAGYIFAEQRNIWITLHQVGERKIDRLRQGNRLGKIACILCEKLVSRRA